MVGEYVEVEYVIQLLTTKCAIKNFPHKKTVYCNEINSKYKHQTFKEKITLSYTKLLLKQEVNKYY